MGKEIDTMAFVDEFSQKARELAGAASEMAKEAAGNVKVTASILAEQREMDKNYRAIGEWYVSQLDGEVPAEGGGHFPGA